MHNLYKQNHNFATTQNYRESLKKYLTETEVLTGCTKSDIVYAPIISMITMDYPFEFKLLHLTAKLWFAMAINRVQTLKLADIDNADPRFTHDQFYVACSQVSLKYNLYILHWIKKWIL